MAMQQLELWSVSNIAASGGEHVSPRAHRPALALVDPLLVLDAHTQSLLDNARAPRTREAYERDWHAFQVWCQSLDLSALPASTQTLARYLTHLAEGGRKVSTIRRARTAVGLRHADAGAPRPDHDARIRTLERGIGKTYGAREESARPLLLEDLERMLSTLGTNPRDDRDRTLLLVGFWGAFRAGELAELCVEQLQLQHDRLHIFVARSKEDPCGRGETVVIGRAHEGTRCALQAVQRWLDRMRQTSGPLLRTVMGDRVLERPMAPRAISRVVARLSRRAGLEHADEYSSHSLRAGLATSAYVRGVSEREIQEFSDTLDAELLGVNSPAAR